MTTPNSDDPALPDPSADVRRMDEAAVWKGDRLAAHLRRTVSGTVFAYTDDYLRDPGPPIATSLPLSPDPVLTTGGAVPAYFAGLIPEGRRLTALRNQVKTSADDELSLVLAIGADPVGDVQVMPAGMAPYVPAPSLTWQVGSGVVFQSLLDDAGILNRRGLAGVQDKASAAMITLPARWSGHDAIVKFSPPEYPFLVENEAWFLSLAARAGLPTARHQVIHDATGQSALLLERFDRMGPYDHPTRMAVEDATQVMGLHPADKYRVTTEEVARALARPCQAPVVALRDVFRLVVFAWLTGNGDLHAKNISILRREGEWRVAPAYDIPSTLPYGDDSMALTIEGRDRDLSRRVLVEFARSIGLPEAAADSVIVAMLVATEGVLSLFQERRHAFTHPRNANVVKALAYRRRLLAG